MRDRSSVLVRGLRILRSYIATHPLPFTIAVTGAAVYAAATIGTTVVLGRITDHVLRPADGQAAHRRIGPWTGTSPG